MPTATLTNRVSVGSLSRTERTQLQQLEDVLQTARRWAVEEAKALLEIKEKKLWRGRYKSFEDYGLERWGYEHSQLYRLTQWGEVIRTVSPIGEHPLRETHARPLYGLTRDQQREAWKSVCRRHNGRRTAADVEAVVQAFLEPARPQERAASAQKATGGKIVCADAIEGVKLLDDASVDLFLFSPPYCEQRIGRYPGVSESKYADWMTTVMEAIRPKLGGRGNVLIVAREHVRNGQISDVWLRTRLAIRSLGYCESETLIWHAPDKPPLGRPDRPRRTWEYVYWFSGSPRPFVDLRACGNAIQESQSRMLRPRRRKSHLYGWENRQGLFQRCRGGRTARVTDLITASVGGVSPGVDHVAMFPMALADQLVRTYSPEGGLVADPMMGSGTTLLAARDAGRRWWGCDIVQQYVNLARRRLAQ